MTTFKILAFTVNSKLTQAGLPTQYGGGFSAPGAVDPLTSQTPIAVASPYFVPTPAFGPQRFPLPTDFELGFGNASGAIPVLPGGLIGGIGGLPVLGPSPLDLQFGRITNVDYPTQIIPGRAFNIITRVIHRIAGIGRYSVRIHFPTIGVSSVSDPVDISHFGEGIVIGTVTLPMPPQPTTTPMQVSGVSTISILFQGRNVITGSLELLRVNNQGFNNVSGGPTGIGSGLVVDDSRMITLLARGTAAIDVNIPPGGGGGGGLPFPFPGPSPIPGGAPAQLRVQVARVGNNSYSVMVNGAGFLPGETIQGSLTVIGTGPAASFAAMVGPTGIFTTSIPKTKPNANQTYTIKIDVIGNMSHKQASTLARY